MKQREKDILWFKEVDKDDVDLVGGKGANLGEMASFGISVPDGFIVTSKAYFDFIKENKLKSKIYHYLKDIDFTDPEQVRNAAGKVKKIIMEGKISPDLSKKIINAYLKLGGIISHALVAIRSSATAEDLPTASFAGQQVTFLNVKGESNVVQKVKECWASLFEPRAIFYRQEKGFDHFKVGMAVPVQEMISAAISGVMFTVDPVTNHKNRIVIEAIYGLGEFIVQGIVTPDRYVVSKRPMKVTKRHLAKQTVQLIKSGKTNKKTKVPKKLRLKRKLSDKQIIELAKIGQKIHRHYFYPQDIEWVFSKNKFHIVQTRPVTTLTESKDQKDKRKGKKIKRKAILKGQSASPGMVSGPVQIVKSARQIGKVDKGEILVTSMTTPDFVPAMKKAVAIVTDQGGQTSHAAIVSRELGVPCVVGTGKATKKLKNGQIITVNGSQGEIYKGGLSASEAKMIEQKKKDKKKKFHLPSSIKTATKVYVNLGEPDLAKKTAQKNVDGVGLLRAEFMIAQVGVHPKKLIKEKHEKKFITELVKGLTKFCQAFHPRPVVYRTTDFKTNEYRNLTGGKSFEPQEENPLLGYRGAFRYRHDPEVFELELKAIRETRKKFNNLWLMIPFVRTPEELREVKKIIVSQHLTRTASFKLWLMVEIPSNVILLEEFIKAGIDGVSIGSNDLTMLLLGVDRDNEDLAKVFDERNPAVLWALEKTIKTCQKHKITSSICGQAPTFYEDLAAKLVEWGITSLSVSPDAVERTRELVYKIEEEKIEKK